MAINIEEPLVVLLLEDNQDDERLALRALRTCGVPMVVRIARDGQLGIEALGLNGDGNPLPAPDLIISDLKMPLLSGDEVLALTRSDERLRNVPYVMFTSSAEPSDLERCRELGASAYYVKPVNYQEYIECAKAIARFWLVPAPTPEPECEVDPPAGTSLRNALVGDR